jgi:8-oxo-dGTP pyrophosphatase MutT (NUDIX family)
LSDAHGEMQRSRFAEATGEKAWPNVRPKDAATLVIVDRSGKQPKVLMGKRHHALKFMAGKFVFPGGRIEPGDRHMPAAGELDPDVARALESKTVGGAARRGRALAMTAIRETFEETGLMLGRPADAMPGAVRQGPWASFFERRLLPDLSAFTLIGRAITPPGRRRRFDTRFFAVDRTAIGAEVEGVTGPEAELVELVWVDLPEARQLDLPGITTVMLDELEHRIAAGFGHALPVPFYRVTRQGPARELL